MGHRPERLKGANNKVKKLKGPPARSQLLISFTRFILKIKMTSTVFTIMTTTAKMLLLFWRRI